MPARTHGRAAELEKINDLLRAELGARSEILLVEGPAGSGKTHLIQEAARAAEHLGVEVTSTRTRRLDSGDLRNNGICGTQRSFGDRDPVLVIADGVTAMTESFITSCRTARTVPLPPVLWLVSMRSVHARLRSQPPLADQESAFTRIELPPLAQAAVEDMVADLVGHPPDLELLVMVRAAGGNAQLVVDLVEGLYDEGAIQVRQGMARLVGNGIPKRVRATVDSWSAELSNHARHVLQVSAALGRSFALCDLVVPLTETSPSALPGLDEVLASGLLTLTGNQLSFSHRLVWWTLKENLPEDARAMLRKDVRHRWRDHRPSPAARYGGTLPAALLCRDRPPVLGAAERLVPALSMARGSLRCPPHSGVLKDLLPALSCELADFSGVRRPDRQALDADAGARRIIGLLTDDEAAARRHARAVLQQGHRDATAVMAATVLSNLEWAAGKLSDGVLWGRKAVQWVDRTTPESWRPYPALALAAKLIDLGDLYGAGSLISIAHKEVVQRGLSSAMADILITRSRLLLKTGNLARACEEAENAVSIAAELGADWVVLEGLALRGVLALRAGEHSAASHYLHRCGQELDQEYPVFPPLRYSWGEFLMSAGQLAPEEAVRLLVARHRELLARPLLFVEEPAAAPWLFRLAQAAGDAALAATVARAVEQLALGNPEHPAIAFASVHTRGLSSGDIEALKYVINNHVDPWARELAWEDATALVRASASGLSDAVQPPELRPLPTLGDGEGMRADAGSPVPEESDRVDAPSRLQELTEVEHLIIRLVAGGLTNSQVARRLARSPHTINYHLRQIFRKLGVNSRVALTKMFYETAAPGGGAQQELRVGGVEVSRS
jgi:DNA-binding CsgD family transcriptional regulator